MKKLIAVILLLAMCVTALVACGGDNDESSQSDVSVEPSEESEYINEEGLYTPRFPVEDCSDKTFTIIVRGPKAGTYRSDDFTTDSELYGELLNDAVQKRNDKIEELYHVTLDVVQSDTINDDIRNDTIANLGTYDAIMPTLPSLATFSAENLLIDLRTLNHFDEKAPWYDKHLNEAFSFNNKLYFTTGDITILNKVNTPSVLFSKELVQVRGLDNPYQLVEEKKWTFDKMIEMAKSVSTVTSNPDESIYGMVSAYGDAIGFFGASGETICAKTGDDMPYLSFGQNQRSINITQKVLSELTTGDWIVYAQEFEDPIWETSFAVFYEGRALFRYSAFSATTKLRSRSTKEFGILPMPLMDETQEDYCSYCGTTETVGVAIPICAKDPEFSAYMIDAYSAWAKNTITKAYYEVNLKTRDARDDESEAMLDIIFDNIVYDIGECYNFGDMRGMFYDLMKAKSADIVSAFETRKGQVEEAIETIKEAYED